MAEIKTLFHGLLAASNIAAITAGTMILNSTELDSSASDNDVKKYNYMHFMGTALITAALLNSIYIFVFFRQNVDTYKTLSLVSSGLNALMLLGCVVIIAMLGDKFNRDGMNKGVIAAVSIAFAVSILVIGYTFYKRNEMTEMGMGGYMQGLLPPSPSPIALSPPYQLNSAGNASSFFLY